MNYTTEQLKKGREIRMTETERISMRENLAAFMKAHPAPESKASSFVSNLPSPYSQAWGGLVFMRVMASALVLVLLVGSGATFASAKAVPGSLLYPIRIHVKEKAERALLHAPEKKLAYDQARLEARISELETLAAADKEEDPETVFTAKAAFTENLSDFEKTLALNEESGRIAVSLQTREAIASRLAAYAPEPEAPVATMMMAKMSVVSATAETTLDTQIAQTEQEPITEDAKGKRKDGIRELLKVSRIRIMEHQVLAPKETDKAADTTENSEPKEETDTQKPNDDTLPVSKGIPEISASEENSRTIKASAAAKLEAAVSLSLPQNN